MSNGCSPSPLKLLTKSASFLFETNLESKEENLKIKRTSPQVKFIKNKNRISDGSFDQNEIDKESLFYMIIRKKIKELLQY